jgi:hypothetical protein
MKHGMYNGFAGASKCEDCPKHTELCDEIRKREIEDASEMHIRSCVTGHLNSDSLCWCCYYSMPEPDCICPWTKSKKPVKGWDATQRKHDGNITYKVHNCPLFKRGTVKWEIE